MDIEEFDVADAAGVRQQVLACADVPRWADAVLAGRPYGEERALLARAEELARTWTGDEVERALADHPRIGERHAGGPGAAHSSAEQAGVDPEDADVTTRLVAGNHAYEERFGRIFLVRAAGRDAEEILGLLEQRLRHDPVTELEVTGQQLREIALLRLATLVAGSAS